MEHKLSEMADSGYHAFLKELDGIVKSLSEDIELLAVRVSALEKKLTEKV